MNESIETQSPGVAEYFMGVPDTLTPEEIAWQRLHNPLWHEDILASDLVKVTGDVPALATPESAPDAPQGDTTGTPVLSVIETPATSPNTLQRVGRQVREPVPVADVAPSDPVTPQGGAV